MSFFKRFRKKDTPAYDPTNVTVYDLDLGFIFDYDMQSWQVTEVYEYDWGNNFFSREYKVDSGTATAFLSVEDDDELELVFAKKVKLNRIEGDIAREIIKNQMPPKEIRFEGKTYYRDSENPGFFRVLKPKTTNLTEFISWTYYDMDEKYALSIEQWGEREFEAAAGILLDEFQLSNITPASS